MIYGSWDSQANLMIFSSYDDFIYALPWFIVGIMEILVVLNLTPT